MSWSQGGRLLPVAGLSSPLESEQVDTDSIGNIDFELLKVQVSPADCNFLKGHCYWASDGERGGTEGFSSTKADTDRPLEERCPHTAITRNFRPL